MTIYQILNKLTYNNVKYKDGDLLSTELTHPLVTTYKGKVVLNNNQLNNIIHSLYHSDYELFANTLKQANDQNNHCTPLPTTTELQELYATMIIKYKQEHCHRVYTHASPPKSSQLHKNITKTSPP